jgi:hypothetical protein
MNFCSKCHCKLCGESSLSVKDDPWERIGCASHLRCVVINVAGFIHFYIKKSNIFLCKQKTCLCNEKALSLDKEKLL